MLWAVKYVLFDRLNTVTPLYLYYSALLTESHPDSKKCLQDHNILVTLVHIARSCRTMHLNRFRPS